jgi:hypothetical protein
VAEQSSHSDYQILLQPGTRHSIRITEMRIGMTTQRIGPIEVEMRKATIVTDTLQLAVKTLRRGNASLTNRRGDPRGGQDRIYSTPGREGDLWIAAYDGLYHSTTRTGFDFRALDKVRTIYAFGFGKAKPGSNYPALYLIGVVNGQYGFFRSDDAAVSWMRINDDAHQYGLVLHICGDMQEYGRVYIGTHGRGIVTGVPSSD